MNSFSRSIIIFNVLIVIFLFFDNLILEYLNMNVAPILQTTLYLFAFIFILILTITILLFDIANNLADQEEMVNLNLKASFLGFLSSSFFLVIHIVFFEPFYRGNSSMVISLIDILYAVLVILIAWLGYYILTSFAIVAMASVITNLKERFPIEY